MKLNIDVGALFDLVAASQNAMIALIDAAEDIAETLAADGQGELKEKLAELRAENDAARERRRLKAARATGG